MAEGEMVERDKAEAAVERLLSRAREFRHYLPVHSKQYLVEEMRKILSERDASITPPSPRGEQT